jgi:hypothetical protein
MGLTGQSFNANVGSVSIEDQVVGLTGFTITATVGTPFIIHYQDVDTGSNTAIIVEFQRVQIVTIQMLQLAQIQAIQM